MTPEQPTDLAVIVAARNEANSIGATLKALGAAMPGARLWVADDASDDATADIALAAGARLVSRKRPHGKGANMTAAAQAVLSEVSDLPQLVLLCDADLGESAGELVALVEAVRAGDCDLAIAAFRARVGGGFGITLRASRWAIRRRSGYVAGAPISGQRAMRFEVLRTVLPFAAGYGMETGMTIDSVRAGFRVEEIELDLEHRATGRTLAGFVHRGRQLAHIARAYVSRRA